MVMGMLDRGRTVRTKVISSRSKNVMQPVIRENAAPGSETLRRMGQQLPHG
jgi:hypothetical protein